MTQIDSKLHVLQLSESGDISYHVEGQLSAAIKLAKHGDVQAFKFVYEHYLPMVYGLCFRLCADTSQAEDATQEVFIQLWQKMAQFKGQSKFSTWLHSVASNVCISYIRKQKGWWQRMFSMPESTRHQQVDEGDIHPDDIELLVMRLPERTRMVFVLHGIEGYRHEQVANILSISINTSKVQFHRARALIEEWVNE